MTAHQLVGFSYLPIFCLVIIAVTYILLQFLQVTKKKRKLLLRLAVEIGGPVGAAYWLFWAWISLPDLPLLLPVWAENIDIVIAAWIGLGIIALSLSAYINWRIKKVLGWRDVSEDFGADITRAIYIIAIIIIVWGYFVLMTLNPTPGL